MLIKDIIKKILPVIDFAAIPFVFLASLVLKPIRWIGVHHFPLCRKVFCRVGLFPIRNHYYEPLFDGRKLKPTSGQNRNLPGIDWNIDEQIALLDNFSFNEELETTLLEDDAGFQFGNHAFEAGDAEYLYNLIRLKKPARIFEIGSGYSTLVARKAIQKNCAEDPEYSCKHVCIEPYEMPWLEDVGVEVVRERVEEVGLDLFLELEAEDLLFIDSSHMIRPQGDVLFECLELLPSLAEGVCVHFHDIFSPRDYPRKWIVEEVRLWNEQYLLEAFLTDNRSWEIMGALNYLHHNHYNDLRSTSPFLTPSHQPGSFYIQKRAR